MIPLLFPRPTHQKRREELAAQLQPDQDVLVYFTAPFRYRNHDSSYRFRPDSSFLYLTGFPEPEATLLLWREKQGSRVRTRSELFVLPRDPAREQWDGYRYGPARTKTLTGVEAAHPVNKLPARLVEVLYEVCRRGKGPRVLSNARKFPERQQELTRWLECFEPNPRSGEMALGALMDAAPLVEKARLIKSKDELACMRKASKINVQAHLEVMKALRPGMWEYQLQAVAEHVYQQNGCQDPAYTSICGSGSNATILHYVENNRRIRAGELFLIDAGCEYKWFTSDITRTLPADGKYSKAQRAIMDVVAEAHQATLNVAKPGTKYTDMHETASLCLIEGLQSLRLLKKGSARKIYESNAHKRYYPHGTGHWLGMDVHDSCPYVDDQGRPLRLRPGMVFTIEPGLYFLPNDKTVPAEYRGIGVRIEDDVVVTKSKPEVLTAGLPRTASEIERFMARRGK